MLEKSFEGIPHSHGMQSKKYVSKKGGSHVSIFVLQKYHLDMENPFFYHPF